MWNGDYQFLLRNLIVKDFKIRYRNMSLGVFWSLINPLIMMGVLAFVFARIFRADSIPHYALYILCGILPFNFLTMAWVSGTSSLLDNAGLIKRVPVPREIVPIASVLSNCLHLLIQIGLLLTFVVLFGVGVNVEWFWLPFLWGLAIMLVCGMSLITSGLNIYMRDTRYVVESVNTVLFWLIPVFYPLSMVPAQYRNIYMYNPVAVLVEALRYVLLKAEAPPANMVLRLTVFSFGALIVGLVSFNRLKARFYDYL
ncbi:MAG TPA: ABC transporter permease [Bryobacteraceae bacterium]|nr:ABC transporter permease [Bryobacteraceae bacterium]